MTLIHDSGEELMAHGVERMRQRHESRREESLLADLARSPMPAQLGPALDAGRAATTGPTGTGFPRVIVTSPETAPAEIVPRGHVFLTLVHDLGPVLHAHPHELAERGDVVDRGERRPAGPPEDRKVLGTVSPGTSFGQGWSTFPTG